MKERAEKKIVYADDLEIMRRIVTQKGGERRENRGNATWKK